MFESDFIVREITAIIFLAIFLIGRFAWSKFKGKREKRIVSSEIVSERSLIQIFVSGVVPAVLILNLFDLRIITSITDNIILYWIGFALALAGLIFMFLARLHRQKDWGFMGDSAGDMLFTNGIYKTTRHPYYVGSVLIGIGVYLILNS